ncbi:MAG: hypothetical protein PHU25_05380 [Deltaproteobacteria bacterium]|nr:hypothetical protein [Deltaproteobacteria bacterium]
MRRTSITRVLARAFLAGTMLVAAGCGPKEGTPEYVLAKLREGRLVGAKNLALLTERDVPEMKAVLEDPAVPRDGRMQVLQWMMDMGMKDEATILPAYLSHRDSEVRLRIAQWMTYRGGPSMLRLLVDRLKVEKEELVRLAIVSALQRVGDKIENPDQTIVAEMLASFANPAEPHRDEWARVLGGWAGENVVAGLSKALSDKDPKIELAAAEGLIGPRLRPISVATRLEIGMLEHPLPEVRRTALSGLVAAMRPGRVKLTAADCAEKPTLTLLGEAPDLASIMDAHLERKDVDGQERKLAQEVKRCATKFTGGDDTDPAGAKGGH